MTTADLPRDFPGLKALIAQRASAMPRRLAQIAVYALEHPDEIAFGTVASIAESAGVQPSTLVRFAQSLGFTGFSDLQEIFQSRLRERLPNYAERLDLLREHARDRSKTALLLDGFSEAAEKSIRDLRERLDTRQLDKVVERLAKAETLYLIGLRRSYPIATYMAYAFGQLGVRSTLIDARAGLAAEELGFAGKRDCIMAISFTPYASETVALVKAQAERGIPVVAITDSPFSPLASTADTWIEVQEGNFEGFRSMAATMALAMTLTVAVAERRGKASK